jgi:hypothetical protein
VRFVLLAAVAVVLLAGAESARACSCAPLSVKAHLEHADGAFNGRLLSVRPVERSVQTRFRYRVGVVLEGPLRRGQVVTVWSVNSEAACGLSQGVGRVYGLFVTRQGGRWRSGLCSTVAPSRIRRAAGASAAAGGSACA